MVVGSRQCHTSQASDGSDALKHHTRAEETGQTNRTRNNKQLQRSGTSTPIKGRLRMSILRTFNGLFTKTPAFAATRRLMLGLTFLTIPSAMFAVNKNCTLIVPNNPLTAAGLATP